ncbi:hypothetical protein D3C79_454150 [compost metagenome]
MQRPLAQPLAEPRDDAPLRDQQVAGLVSCSQGIKPVAQLRVFIGKQRDQQRIRHKVYTKPLQKGTARLRRLLERVTPGQQRTFAQQTARFVGKAREKEYLAQTVGLRRRQPMATLHPVLGTQVLEVEPERRLRTGAHGLDIRRGQLAGERADHHIGRRHRQPRCRPVAHIHTVLPLLRRRGIGARAHGRESVEVIHPQAHRQAVLGHQLPGQAPGHANIAVVVDDAAEDVPGGFHAPLPCWCKNREFCA